MTISISLYYVMLIFLVQFLGSNWAPPYQVSINEFLFTTIMEILYFRDGTLLGLRFLKKKKSLSIEQIGGDHEGDTSFYFVCTVTIVYTFIPIPPLWIRKMVRYKFFMYRWTYATLNWFMFQNSDFRIFSKERGAIKSIECMEQGDNNALLIVKKDT